MEVLIVQQVVVIVIIVVVMMVKAKKKELPVTLSLNLEVVMAVVVNNQNSIKFHI